MNGNWFDDPSGEPEKRKPIARRKREPRSTSDRRPDRKHPPTEGTKCGVRRADAKPCASPAGWGTDHLGYGSCRYHMGNTPEGRKSGAMSMAEELIAFYGEPIDVDPITALLDEVKRTAGHVAWLGKRIGQFDIPLTIGEGEDKQIAELPPEVAGWLTVYHSERGQLVRVSKAALDAGVNERLVQIAEYQGERLADAVEGILNRLELSEHQWALVPAVVPDILRGLMDQTPPRLIEGAIEEQVT